MGKEAKSGFILKNHVVHFIRESFGIDPIPFELLIFYFHSLQFVPRIQETAAALLLKRLHGHASLGPFGELYTEKSKIKFQENLRSEGLCSLTPKESILMLAALGFNQNQNRNIFIAGSNLYRDRSRLAALTSLHPKLNLVSSAKLKPFANSSSEYWTS
ncbi:GDP-fucose protein O-fucosyltransferase [Medicago truncatula]|uniref:O-fucosyltransferase family protein n=1 Tax=Medicago truncatula TaxID=3880 RepID=G7JKF0_MEDTR|nr:GDP-fucose protein O-fucosyltransferase [Medicago truncatula]